MRIRNGFVSNSSSTSFCIYGIYLSNDEKHIKKCYKKFIPNGEATDTYEMIEEMLENVEKISFSVYSNDGDGYFIGREWMNIQDNETGKEFKTNVEKNLNELFGVTKFRTYDEVVYG
jgi:hypothetical protein